MAGNFRLAIHGRRNEFIEMINVEKRLLIKLLDANIIDRDQLEYIDAERTSYSKGFELVKLLEIGLRSDDQLDTFCKILTTERNDAVKLIQRNLQSLPGEADFSSDDVSKRSQVMC
jgi:hypothetical protein